MGKGIVCDVGHVIVTESILNQILAELGRHDLARSLYDLERLRSCSQLEIENWVETVIREKVGAMKQRSRSEISTILANVKLTPGFREMVSAVAGRGFSLMLMGAVPEFVTEILIRDFRHEVDYVAGSSVSFDADDRIIDTTYVLTPLRKARKAAEWMNARGIKPAECWVIGDSSIGDLPTMEIVPFHNRIGFNADAILAHHHVAQRFESNMYHLCDWILSC